MLGLETILHLLGLGLFEWVEASTCLASYVVFIFSCRKENFQLSEKMVVDSIKNVRFISLETVNLKFINMEFFILCSIVLLKELQWSKEVFLSIISMCDAQQTIANLHFRRKFMYFNFVIGKSENLPL